MSQSIVDLDALVPPDKKATLGGTVYTVPGDMPLETFLRMQRVAQSENEGVDESDLIIQLKSAMFDLFATNVSATDTAARERLQVTLDGLGIKTFMGIFRALYNEEIQKEDAEDPTPEPQTEG